MALREEVFQGPNDCTVSEKSSQGGLKPPYTTTIRNVLHGFATQYRSVQECVARLLKSEGDSLFDPKGFPDAYPDR